jgi:hypothetical protein
MSIFDKEFPYNATVMKAIVERKGYKWFENPKGHDLNIVGIRTDDNTANTFNDWITFSYTFDGKTNLWAFPCTTDPGLYYRENPANLDGTAIVVPGQYRGLWSIGKHQGKYTALKQTKPVKVYRDNDKDGVLEESNIQEGIFGINMHRASATRTSTQVDRWSAGCQVMADYQHFDFVMELCQRQIDTYTGTWGNPNSFTYTLLEESDFTSK